MNHRQLGRLARAGGDGGRRGDEAAPTPASPNPLGAGQVFLALIGRPLLAAPIELSLHSLGSGLPGTLTPGPELRDVLPIEALLVGCGGVANGWTYAIKRLPLIGAIEAIDHQACARRTSAPTSAPTARH